MRRVLAAGVLLAFVPTANAQDKAKSEFTPSAEYRARYFYLQNPSAKESDNSSQNMAEGRFKLGLDYRANEKISAHATLLHNTNFGIDNNTDAAGGNTGAGTASTTPPGTTTVNDQDNLISVNEAYVNWMSSDDMNFRIGRMNYHVADGSFISSNDWEKIPYSFEGLQANWEQEWGKLQFVAFKVRNLATVDNVNHPATNSSASDDAEHNMYGINFDLKTMPEWLKGVNAHIFKDTGDALGGGSGSYVMSTTNGVDTLRYGLMGKFAFSGFDAGAWYEAQGGKLKNITAAGVKTDLGYKGQMYQIELGYTLENFMMSRFFLLYHRDSGDDNTGDNDLKGYDPYYYDMHANAGLMDLLAWGNLTQISLGWTFKTDDRNDFGLAYHMFSKTEKSSTTTTAQGVNFGTMGAYGGGREDLSSRTQKADADKIGDEIDLWATHHYNDNLATTFRVGYFMPGDVFEPTAAGTEKSTDKILHVMIEGKATF
ncbi:MAG: alginate export family protein [Bdellovibrionales bacterium]